MNKTKYEDNRESVKRRIIEIFASCNSVVISCHMDPEADAVGSSISLGLALKNLGKKVHIYNKDGIPNALKNLPHSEMVSKSLPAETPDLFCVLDCSSLDRIGEEGKTFAKKVKKIINIDHHVTSQMFAHENFVDETAPSTGLLIFELLRDMKVEITPEIATNLYASFAKDTGCFILPVTDTRTLDAASFVLGKGADLSIVMKSLKYSPLKRIKLMQEFLRTVRVVTQDNGISIVLGHLKKGVYKKSKACEEDSEDFVELIRGVEGAPLAVFVRESQNQERTVKASIRSEKDIDLSEIAVKFNGGGHRNAVGCKFTGKSVREVEEILIKELLKLKK